MTCCRFARDKVYEIEGRLRGVSEDEFADILRKLQGDPARPNTVRGSVG